MTDGARIQVVRQVWYGDLVRAVVHKAGDEGTREAAEAVLELANEHVPYDEGDLEASGDVNRGQSRYGPTGQFAANEWFVFYDTPYAVRLHEHPEYHFQGKGEGKWLEHAIEQRAAFVEADMAPPLREAFLRPGPF